MRTRLLEILRAPARRVKNTSNAHLERVRCRSRPFETAPEWGTKFRPEDEQSFQRYLQGQPAGGFLGDPEFATTPTTRRSVSIGKLVDTGPSWVASVVNAVGKSQYWNRRRSSSCGTTGAGSTTTCRRRRSDNQGGPGFRVPMIVVSPYVPAGEMSSTPYEFGSILRYIEDNWGLAWLGTTDLQRDEHRGHVQLQSEAAQVQAGAPEVSRIVLHAQKPPSNNPVDDQWRAYLARRVSPSWHSRQRPHSPRAAGGRSRRRSRSLRPAR